MTDFAKTDYHEAAQLNVMRATTLTAFTPYLALSTTEIANDGTGITEPVGDGYAREPVTLGAPVPGALVSDGSSCQNTVEVSFQANGGDWGEITWAAIYDALTVGNMRYYGELTAAKTIGNADILTFAIGAITIKEK